MFNILTLYIERYETFSHDNYFLFDINKDFYKQQQNKNVPLSSS